MSAVANSSFSSRVISRWVDHIQRFRYAVIISFMLLCLFSVFYIKNHLSMSTDISNMLSEELPWRKLDIAYERLFPQFVDNMLIVIEASSPDQAADTATTLYLALKEDSYLIKDIYYPSQLPYFRQSAFLFMEEDELYELSDRLASIQPFIGTLLEDKNLRGLFTMLTEALDAIAEGKDIDINPLLLEINKAFADQQYRVSWQGLMSNKKNDAEVYREFIMLKTLESEQELLPGEDVIAHVNQLISKLKLEQHSRIRLTGNTALSYEELKSVAAANITAIAVSLLLVTVILIFGLGSVWLFVSSMLTLLAGLIVTTAFAAATVGELNLISVAFAVLYIGLGIDFAIHLCLRFREESQHQTNNHSALQIALSQIFRTLLLCALTTAIGFYSFMPTDYQGVAELGWIAGSGMFISMLFTFILLPALLSAKSCHFRQTGNNHFARPALNYLSELPYRYPRFIVIASVALVVIVLSQIARINFDTNTLNLQNPDNESVQTYQDLLKDSDTSPWRGILLKQSDEVQQAKHNIEKLDVVDSTIWIEDLIPNDQEEKLFLIDEMSLMMGPLITNNASLNIEAEEQYRAIGTLLAAIESIPNDALTKELRVLKTNLHSLTAKPADKQTLNDLEQRLLTHLDGRIASLADALAATEVAFKDIPETIRNRWISDDFYKIELIPKKNLNDNTNRAEFVRTIQKHDNEIIGPAVVSIEAGSAVLKAFQDALGYAFIAIAILLIVLIKKKSDAVVILMSVMIGGTFTLGLMMLFQIPFNFANIIGLPLLLGIGVDSGIHIANRFRQEQHTNNNIFATSASRGVFVSSMTTICSIGNLGFSAHTGTASMGLMLALGLLAMLIATMCILPAFLIWQSDHIR